MPRSQSRSLFPRSASLPRRWRADDARAVLARLDSSGLSVPQFAAREGLDVQRLYRWRAQLRTGRAKTPTPAFIEVTPSVSAAATSIEVVLPSGHVVRVSDGFGEGALRRLLAVLDERGGSC